MKFLTFTDLHEDKGMMKEIVKRASKDDVDFVVCCGDISTFGKGLRYNLQQLNSIGKKVYFIPGNHEEGRDFQGIVSEFENCMNLDRKAVKIGDFVFLGYGGGGFTLQDPEFRKKAREWYGEFNGQKIVLITHQPPYGTKLDDLNGNHVGNKDYRTFIERLKVKVSVSGHLHETVGLMDKIGDTKLINPGWEGMVVELN